MSRRIQISVVVAIYILIAPLPSFAQDGDATRPAAATADVESVDAIIAAVYDVISGPAGEARDWNRFRSLFLPTANLVPVFSNQEGRVDVLEMTPEDYIERSGDPLVEMGFFESEIARVEERFGNLVHAFSTYEGFRGDDLETPFVRGVNSIQVLFKDGRWWIANLAWQREQAGEEILLPEKYLPLESKD
jgi:hypothetical protein